MLREVRLALGSNLGDREAHLESARVLIEDSIVQAMECSPVHETEPVGPPQGPYLNQILRGCTELDPAVLLARCQAIECSLGRKRVERWGPRIIDIDILTLGQLQWRDDSLTIPHPGIGERIFVLAPWAELEPEFEVPVLGKTVQQLLEHLHHRIPEESGR
ncbi:MAG: 2-amino-4-hydroxy-6-hydroxymethyldihydropteridine diphosphokinase [Planctomycetota bacterium]|nr:MAG: 2-amino-4-hydroxy-6-hydroxymethyldihydropteridine diphosphokinase [Planctomycetota bacterium]